MAAGLGVGLVCFFLFFAGHVATLRRRAKPPLFLIGLLAIPVMVGLLAAIDKPHWPRLEIAAAILCGGLLYCGLYVLYAPFYYVVMTSLSVRTTVLLGRQADGAMPLQTLHDRFASRQLVAQRLQTMTANGFLRATPQGYALTGKGRLTARFFDLFKRLWMLGSGG
jgi:hypothetical protein